MKADEIRSKYLAFFESKGHRIVPSDSLVPVKDPSLLFTGAGMNQFKEQFMGINVTFKRATTSQKCMRTGDLDNVGRTSSHHTFFEMLGNFSFGDYFKREAISWAWEFLTKHLMLSEKDLQVSVYYDDQEACDIWLNEIHLPPEKIIRMGDKDNFWPSEAKTNGPNGPCGPCSEIYFIPKSGEPVEIWNLVFTQYNRKDGGLLEDLPHRNIDTGMGLERLCAVMQGVRTNFEIDTFVPLVSAIGRILGCAKGADPVKDAHLNAIADHIRAVTFAIADGVYPSNEERGFVIRKLIRRSLQRASQITQLREPFLFTLVPVVAAVMKVPYPEIERERETISQIIVKEEERFLNILSNVLPPMKEEFLAIRNSGAREISGQVIFKYSDERGVPVDFQKEVADELGVALNVEGFNAYLAGQKERSRQKSKMSKEIFGHHHPGAGAAPSGLLQREEAWDDAAQERIRANHTATHLLHAALRRVLGEHARQAGSLVTPDRLRFDFTHPKKVESAEVEKVEALINEHIAAGHAVERSEMPIDEARRAGATALFGEKYTETVVVRTIGDFSKELCSGDHIDNTRKIGVLKVITEASVAAGTRRIEAVTGSVAYDWLIARADEELARVRSLGASLDRTQEAEQLMADIHEQATTIGSWLNRLDRTALTYADLRRWQDLEKTLLSITERIGNQKKEQEKVSAKNERAQLDEIAVESVAGIRDIGSVKVLARALAHKDPQQLRLIMDAIRSRVPSAVVLLISDLHGKVNLVL
ncbi:MAG: alanine--tRNA ligase, partial [Candidatus Omnitrophota bacterium]